MSINETDIDMCHRIGRKNEYNAKPRPVIVKFIRYN